MVADLADDHRRPRDGSQEDQDKGSIMTASTFFKDRRTGTVYRFTEKTKPVEGPIPLRAAYRSDTVWISQQHLERVEDPHAFNGWHVFKFTVILLVVAVLWVFSSVRS